MLLTDTLEDSFEYKNKVIKLDMSYDNILRLYQLFGDDELNNLLKLEFALDMLILNYDVIKNESFEEKYEIFKFIMKNFIDEDIGNSKDENEGSSRTSENKKSFDFEVDAERIFASFMMDYKIDLIHLQGKLHWKKFIALFNGLSDETPFKKVVNIREMKIPAPNKYNSEERANIIRLKQRYSLEGQSEKVDKLNSAFEMMKAKAKNSKKESGNK